MDKHDPQQPLWMKLNVMWMKINLLMTSDVQYSICAWVYRPVVLLVFSQRSRGNRKEEQ